MRLEQILADIEFGYEREESEFDFVRKRRKMLRPEDIEARQTFHGIGQAERLAQLKTMPYKEYLASAHWQKVRLMVLRTRGARCQLCSATDVQVEVHHVIYDHRGDEHEHLSDLMILCRECHGLHHHQERENGCKLPDLMQSLTEAMVKWPK